jgi:hypothetical protein
LPPYLITVVQENSSVKATYNQAGAAKIHRLSAPSPRLLGKAFFELQPHGYEGAFSFMSETEMLPKHTKEMVEVSILVT